MDVHVSVCRQCKKKQSNRLKEYQHSYQGSVHPSSTPQVTDSPKHVAQSVLYPYSSNKQVSIHDVSSKHVISLASIHVSNMVVTLATGSSSFSSSLLLGVSIQICSSLSLQDDVEEFDDDDVSDDDDDDDGRPEQAINSSSQFDSSLHFTHSSPNVSNALYIYVCFVCVQACEGRRCGGIGEINEGEVCERI